MRRSLGLVLSLVIALVTIVCGGMWLTVNARADGTLPQGALTAVHDLPTARGSSYDGWNWATPDDAYPYRDASGNLAVATHTGNQLVVDTYDPAGYATVGSERTIDLTGWPRWGGFYVAPSGEFFVLVGKPNHNEDDNLDVVAVRRYSATWSLLGTAYLEGGASQGLKGIWEPFDAGAADMLVTGGRLVVSMPRLMYTIDGVNHQSSLTFEVDLATMTASSFESLGDYAYSSHSFAQYVATAGSSLLTIDHGDAYPRAIQLGVMKSYPAGRAVQTYDLFEFNGATGNNFTGATVDGLVAGSGGAVVVGTSIKHPNAPDGALGSDSEARNAFLIHADPATGAHTLTWLTGFAANGTTTALEPRIVKLAADRWALLFAVKDGSSYRTEYRLIDSAGAVLASATLPGFFFSSVSDPVLVGDAVYWVGIRSGAAAVPTPAYLFGLDVSDPAAPTLLAGGGSTTTPTTPTTAPPTALPPSNVDAPRLRGQAVVGGTLRVEPGTWDPAADSYVYKWFRDGGRMRSVSGTTYAVRSRDRGSTFLVKVIATNAGGSAAAWTNSKRAR